MPRVRPRLRLALLLLLVGGLAFAATAALIALQNSQTRGRASHRRAAPPDVVSVRRVQAAMTPDPALPLDLANTDVLVAMVCTFRRDRVQPYGQARPNTPFLQLMAEHGALFEHAIVQSSWTRPSTGSLLTGRWAEVLQLDDPGDGAFHNLALAPGFVTLAEAMSAHGYHTIGASGNPNISSAFGFDQGFDVYHEPEDLWRHTNGPSSTGADLNAQLLAELDATPADQRVYLQGFYVDTHSPRLPSTKALRAVRTQGDTTARKVLVYDASLLTLDAHLAELYLEVKRRRPNLLFVVVGDHGEGLNLPEHHGKGHGNHLFTSTIDVPFLWFHPALPDPGRRIDGLSMGVDLAPTLLDLLGGALPAPVDGASQAAALRGERERASHTFAYSQTYFRRTDKTAVVGQGYHLIRDRSAAGVQALYELDEPLQQTDVQGNHPQVFRSLAADLDRWQTELAEAVEQQGSPVEGNPST